MGGLISALESEAVMQGRRGAVAGALIHCGAHKIKSVVI